MMRLMLANAGGGGGGGGSLYDDEFNVGSSIDTTGARYASAIPWTLVNQGTATYTVGSGLLTLVAPATGGNAIDLKWATMTPPAGLSRWQAQVSLTSAASNYQQAGFGLIGSGGGVEYISFQNSASFGKYVIRERATGSAVGVTTQLAATAIPAVSSLILEIELVAGPQSVMRYSTDGGSSFTQLGSGDVFFATPAAIGIFVSGGTAASATGTFDWFRKVA